MVVDLYVVGTQIVVCILGIEHPSSFNPQERGQCELLYIKENTGIPVSPVVFVLVVIENSQRSPRAKTHERVIPDIDGISGSPLWLVLVIDLSSYPTFFKFMVLIFTDEMSVCTCSQRLSDSMRKWVCEQDDIVQWCIRHKTRSTRGAGWEVTVVYHSTLLEQLRLQVQRHKPNCFLTAVDVQQQFTAYRLVFF
jgi:hypothetical protein